MDTQDLISRLTSRKFWVPLLGAMCVLFMTSLGISIEQAMTIAVMAVGYVFGQSNVDGKKIQATMGIRVIPEDGILGASELK